MSDNPPKMCRVAFNMQLEGVPTVMQLLADIVEKFTVETLDEAASCVRSAVAAPKPVNRMKTSDTNCGRAIMQIMRDLIAHEPQVTAQQVGMQLEGRGQYKASTAAPTISALVREGKIVRHGTRGNYAYSLPAPRAAP